MHQDTGLAVTYTLAGNAPNQTLIRTTGGVDVVAGGITDTRAEITTSVRLRNL